MEELQRKVAFRRGHRAHLTKLNNKMEYIMAGELDAVQRATFAIHIEQLERKRQKLSHTSLSSTTAVQIEDITRWREDMNFMFEWQQQYLTSERSERVRYCSCHE